MLKFKTYIDEDGNEITYREDLMSFEEIIDEWNEYDSWYQYYEYNKLIQEYLDKDVGTRIVKNTKFSFVTYYQSDIAKYKFEADINGDLAIISFSERSAKNTDKNKFGAKKRNKVNAGAVTGVLDSINFLFHTRKDVKRLYFTTVDKDLEKYTDTIISWVIKKKRIKILKYDGSERDIRGNKCFKMLIRRFKNGIM